MKTAIYLTIALSALFSCKTELGSNKENTSTANVTSLGKEHNAPVTYYRKLQVDSIINTLARNDSIAKSLGKSPDNLPYLLCARTKAGDVEVHEQMDDVAIIRSGRGTLKTGHQATGMLRASGKEPWREWFYESIQDSKDQQLTPGDFIIIPAMTAHQYIPAPGDTLTYWTIKVKHLKNMN